MSVNTPDPQGSEVFTYNGTTCAIFVDDLSGIDWNLRIVYLDDADGTADWVYVGVVYLPNNIDSLQGAESDSAVEAALMKVNDRIVKLLGEYNGSSDIPPKPEGGIARVIWLIQYGTSYKDGKLSLTE